MLSAISGSLVHKANADWIDISPSNIESFHQRYQDYVAHEVLSNVFDSSLYPRDLYRNPQLDPLSQAIDGGWNSTTFFEPINRPSGVGFQTQVFYDRTPHTDGLYQFTTVDWSEWPFRVRITHYAWAQDTNRFERTSTIPTPFSALPLVASVILNRRSRR